MGFRAKRGSIELVFLMRPKFQKRSALKFDGRIIPHAKPCGTETIFMVVMRLKFHKRSTMKF